MSTGLLNSGDCSDSYVFLAAAQPSRMAVWATSERIVSSFTMRYIMPLTTHALLTFCDMETYAAAAATVFTYGSILFRPDRSMPCLTVTARVSF